MTKMWIVHFSHSMNYGGCYGKRTVDWTMVEAEDSEAAEKEAKRWVREYRFNPHCKNRVTVLEVREVK